LLSLWLKVKGIKFLFFLILSTRAQLEVWRVSRELSGTK